VIDLNTPKFGRLITGWTVECMNPDVTPYGMSLDVKVSSKKNKQRYNKHLILIRLHSVNWYQIVDNYITIPLQDHIFLVGPSWSWSYGSWITMQSVPITTDAVNSNLDQGEVYNMMWLSLSVTYGRSVVFSGYSSFLH
jgi:hypothetical protein